MSIDTTYGKGATDKVIAAVNAAQEGATITQIAHGKDEDVILFKAEWKSHLLKMFCFSKQVHFDYLSTTCGEKREIDAELYQRLCEKLPPVFKALGVEKLTAEPQDEPSKALLIKHGGFEYDKKANQLVWVLK